MIQVDCQPDIMIRVFAMAGLRPGIPERDFISLIEDIRDEFAD
jgi:hypothetical protein